MADDRDPQDDENETAVLDAPENDEAQEGAPADDASVGDEGAAEGEGAAAETTEETTDEVVIGFGDEPAPEPEDDSKAPAWVREVRKQNRELVRKVRELESERQQARIVQQAPAVLGPMPKMDDPDVDFDADKLSAKMEKWFSTKQQIAAEQARAQEAAQKAENAWRERLTSYGKAKAELRVSDFEDAELAVQETFSLTQQGVMLRGCADPAKMVYALGKNPKKAKELAALTDPVDFAFAVAKLETQLKVTPRTTAPVPERTLRGSAPGAAITNAASKLDKAIEEAIRTGDATKLHQLRMQERQRQKK